MTLNGASRVLVFVIASGLGTFVLLAGRLSSSEIAREPIREPTVLVELFTSQGCSSCPPADAFLGELGQQSGIIPLSYHVDYWNHLGWEDPFSSREWSDRQRAYAQILNSDTIYTPQLVINGTVDEVGSDRRKIQTALAEARKGHSARTAITLTATRRGAGKKYDVVVRTEANVPKGAQLLVALYERYLMTEVSAGENRNKKLIYDFLVRNLRKTEPGEAVIFPIETTWKQRDLGVVAFIQHPISGAVLGIARASEPLDLR